MRKKRYFYAHALIAGEGFEYRADPLAILRGRLIAIVLFALYGAAGQFSVTLQVALGVVFAIAFPWLLVRSLAFNAHNTAYRNIRFHFDGDFLGALKLFALLAALVIVTLGFAYPYAHARLTQFTAGHHRYGTAQCALPSLARTFYGIYLRCAGLLLLLVALFFLCGVLIALLVGRSGMLLTPLGFIVFYLFGFAYVRARFANAIWNHLTIGGSAVRFESRLRARDVAGIYLVNILAIVLTLGLAAPWAVIRTLRYRAQKTALLVAGGLDQFVAQRSAEVDASGEELGELFGFDFGF